MLMLPIETNGHEHDALILIIGPDNLERMKIGDPAEVVLRQSGKRLVNPTVLLCYEEPTPALLRLINSGNLKAIIEYLQRGFKFRPEKGDHDRGPERLGQHN